MLERIRFDTVDISKVNAFDLHYHSEYSFDCQTKLNKILKRAKELGIGISITDHNEIKGNLKAQNNKYGVNVIPGVEITFKEKKDLLFYFYSVDDLKSFFKIEIKPYIRKLSNITSLSIIKFLENFDSKKYNAVVVAPHPFGIAYKNSFRLFNKKKNNHLLSFIDAFEIFNSTESPNHNFKAIKWAYKEQKNIIGGSDGHFIHQLGHVVTYTYTKEHILDSIKKSKNYVSGRYTTYRTKTGMAELMFKAKTKQQVSKMYSFRKKISSNIVKQGKRIVRRD